MKYADQLKDPRWQKKRLEILGRDNFTCCHCGDSKSTLHVHHSSYRKNAEPWDYEDSNFITLCESCHAQVEDLRKEIGAMVSNPLILECFFMLAQHLRGGFDENISGYLCNYSNDGSYSSEYDHLKTAIKCFTSNLNDTQIERLHKAFMYKGKALDILTKIANGEEL